jgi:DNA-binding NtrC family response regulator
MSLQILIVEDDRTQRYILTAMLESKLGYNVIEAEDGPEALQILQHDADSEQNIKLVILDVHMPKMNGLEVLETLSEHYPELPVIMLTGDEDVSVAVEAMKLGAKDFLNKMPKPERLDTCIKNALKISVLEKEVSRLTRKNTGEMLFEDLVGYDNGLGHIIHLGRKAATANIPVMLTGETGVGKEVFARAIHGESRRSGKPFIAVNCGAIPANLVESILFGHEKGAFTGAVTKSVGLFREADGGTIFLDEIGDLPLDAQVKILRVLQQKEIMPVGAKQAIKIDVRIISATNRNLEQEVAAGRFRDDLYFRLNVLPLKLPSLRERREDIPKLIYHFIERYAAAENHDIKDITHEAVKELSQQDWPGNVRELENTIHRALILSDQPILEMNDFVSLKDMKMITNEVATPIPATATAHTPPTPDQLPLLHADGRLLTMDEIESAAMTFSLTHFGNNITQAAKSLGMAKATFYRKLKKMRED